MVEIVYLGALRIAEEITRALGDERLAETYRNIFKKGKRRLEFLFPYPSKVFTDIKYQVGVHLI